MNCAGMGSSLTRRRSTGRASYSESVMNAHPEGSVTFGANAWLVDEMYEQYRDDPGSVSESWREFFQDYRPGGANLARPSTPEVIVEPEPADAPSGPAVAAGSPPAPDATATGATGTAPRTTAATPVAAAPAPDGTPADTATP